ncbi:DUF7553 family protein [Halovivax gelatinilyticus]|uniref:DUF7553 family protein n=1 Tax=Halovivax gelatinilyticus TaxID=2961597 RepID=UPI0020CA7B92|nr:hypothetical protein [Halovivax gelatinilyticus]
MSGTGHVQNARRELETAVERADDDVRDDLRETAAELAAIASGDQPADYAVVDGYLNELRQTKRDADDVADEIDAAIDHLSAYRDDLEQA